MYRRITDPKGGMVAIHFEGQRLQVPANETVAAAILAATPGYTRITVVSGDKRAPYCMMGTCFECSMEIDGVQNRQACMTTVADGMIVKRQIGKREMPE